MAILTLIDNKEIRVTSVCNYGNEPSGSAGYYTVTWNNFKKASSALTVTIPPVLMRTSTTINSISVSINYSGLGNHEVSPSDDTSFLNKILECQQNGVDSFKVTYSYKYNSVTESFTSYAAADAASSTSRSRPGIIWITATVDYTDFEYNISGVGQFDLTLSTNKLLGGKSSLGLTMRILPEVSIASQGLEFLIYPEGYSNKGLSFIYPNALTKNVETTYTFTPAEIEEIDTSHKDTIYDGKFIVKKNNTTVTSEIDLSNKLQIKSAYEPVRISSGFVSLFDEQPSQGASYYSRFDGYVYGKSAPQIYVSNENYFIDNFLTNDSIISMEITNNTDNYTQTYSLVNGFNSFACPPAPQQAGESKSYTYTVTLTDNYESSASFQDTMLVFFYAEPIFSEDFDIYRYLIDPDDHTTKVIDDEGTYGELKGSITVTEIINNSIIKNTISLKIELISTTDTGWTLPYTCYETTLSHTMTPPPTYESNTYYTFNFDEIPINPNTTDPYKTNKTYNFKITLDDGITTIIRNAQFSTATSYFLIEKTGVAIGGISTGTELNPVFDVYYPAKFNNISIQTLNGRTYDTGWVDLSNSKNDDYILDGSSTIPCIIQIRRIGNIVQLCLNIQTVNDSNYSISLERGCPIIELPQDFCPEAELNYYYSPCLSFQSTTGHQDGFLQITKQNLNTNRYPSLSSAYRVWLLRRTSGINYGWQITANPIYMI